MPKLYLFNPHSRGSYEPREQRDTRVRAAIHNALHASGGRREGGSMKHKHHRRNPMPLGLSGDMFVEAAWGVGGAALASLVPKNFAPTMNAGWTGVGASLATTIAASWAAHRFIGAKAGTGIAIGGLITTLTRAVKTLMPGTHLLGNYLMCDFSAPTASDAYGRWQWPGKAPKQLGAMGGRNHRFEGRYAYGGGEGGARIA